MYIYIRALEHLLGSWKCCMEFNLSMAASTKITRDTTSIYTVLPAN